MRRVGRSGLRAALDRPHLDRRYSEEWGRYPAGMISRRRSFALVFLTATVTAAGIAALAACSSSGSPGEVSITPPAPDSGTETTPTTPTSVCPGPTTVGEPLTCAWLQSASNCWAAALAVVASCSGPTGTVSADGLSCVDSHGASTATFSPPALTNPVPPGRLVQYQVTAADAGQSCYSAAFHTAAAPPANPGAAIAITTAPGCVSLTGTTRDLTITCPDGAMHTGNVSDLGACRYPLYAVANDTASVSLSLYWGDNALGKKPGSTVAGVGCGF